MIPKMHGVVLPFLAEPHDEASRTNVALDWLRRVAPHCKAIRSNYDFPAKPRHLPKLVYDFGLQYVGGAWLGGDVVSNLRQMELLVEEARKGSLDIGLLGNEVLFRRFMSPRNLIGYLKEAEARAPSATFTVAERDIELLLHPEVIDACTSLVGVHIYPFWEGVHIDSAIEHLEKMYYRVKGYAGYDKKVVILETGWPSDGGIQGHAVASLQNSQRYIADAVSWGRNNDVEIFIFEAMDELWKEEHTESGGTAGPHFGIWHADGSPKSTTRELEAVESAE